MDFKVKCVRVKKFSEYFTVGKIYDVKDGKVVCDNGWEGETWTNPEYGNADFDAFAEWFRPWYDFELVEDKKVFTKKDLKNGDVIKKRNGSVEILILPLGTLITQCGGFNRISELDDDMCDPEGFDEYDIVAVRRPTSDWQCCFNAFNGEYGTLVYDRERDTKPHLYNGKVVCINLNGTNENNYTVGKIYEFKDGRMTADNGYVFGKNEKFYTFKDWENFTGSKFIEIKE
jgi:hypothetical protein